MTRRLALAATLLLAAIGCASVARPAGPVLSPAATMREAGMVAIRTVVPDIDQDIRYFGSDNFVGTRVDGYLAPHCWLKREAAEALARVERRLRESHQRLRIFDCYRPTRAVAHFMRWANDPADLATKARHYPDFDKPQLERTFPGWPVEAGFELRMAVATGYGPMLTGSLPPAAEGRRG